MDLEKSPQAPHMPTRSLLKHVNEVNAIVHYADFLSNDFAAILSGVETIHASTRPVPKASR